MFVHFFVGQIHTIQNEIVNGCHSICRFDFCVFFLADFFTLRTLDTLDFVLLDTFGKFSFFAFFFGDFKRRLAFLERFGNILFGYGHFALLIVISNDMMFVHSIKIHVEIIAHRIAVIIIVTLRKLIYIVNDCIYFVAILCIRTYKKFDVDAITLRCYAPFAHRESFTNMLTDNCRDFLYIVDTIFCKVILDFVRSGHLPQVIFLRFFRFIFNAINFTADGFNG